MTNIFVCNGDQRVPPRSTGGIVPIEPETETDSECINVHLQQSARWIVVSNSFVGYWPVSIKVGKHTSDGADSITVKADLPRLLLTIGFLAVNLVTCVAFLCYQHEASKQTTFRIGTFVLGIGTVTSANRVVSLCKVFGFRDFFKAIEDQFVQMERIVSRNRIVLKLSLLQTHLRNMFLLFLSLGIVHIYGLFHVCVIDQRFKTLTYTFVMFYSSTLTAIHNSNSLVLLYFIKLLTLLFQLLSERITSISNQSLVDKEICMDRTGFLHLSHILQAVTALEKCVKMFNKLFGVAMFVDVALLFINVFIPVFVLAYIRLYQDNVPTVITLVVRPITFLICFISLCSASTKMVSECQELTLAFQNLPVNLVSPEDRHIVRPNT